MTIQIHPSELLFMAEAKKAFQSSPLLQTYINDDETFIALRMGMDRDCIDVYQLDGGVANFVQQLEPIPAPRTAVLSFAFEMESQLNANDHKGGWEGTDVEYLCRELCKNYTFLSTAMKRKDKAEIRRRCANIANFAMMISENEGGNL